MSNRNLNRRPPQPPGIPGDIAAALWFFGITAVLLLAFITGFLIFRRLPGFSLARESPTVTTTVTLTGDPSITVTPYPSPTYALTITAESSPTGFRFPTITRVPSATFTPRPATNTPLRTRTSTPVRTRTLTPSGTVPRTSTPTSATRTATLPVVSTSTVTITPTATILLTTPPFTLTPSPTATITVTATLTPLVACSTATPTGIYVAADTWIGLANPNTNHGAEGNLSLRNSATDGQRSLLYFDLSGLTGSSVNSATLYLFSSTASPPGINIALHRLTRSFVENEATWTTAQLTQPWTNPGGDYDAAPVANFPITNNCLIALDMVTVIQDWFTTPSVNHGLILIASGPDGASAAFSARENGNGRGPILSVSMNP